MLYLQPMVTWDVYPNIAFDFVRRWFHMFPETTVSAIANKVPPQTIMWGTQVTNKSQIMKSWFQRTLLVHTFRERLKSKRKSWHMFSLNMFVLWLSWCPTIPKNEFKLIKAALNSVGVKLRCCGPGPTNFRAAPRIHMWVQEAWDAINSDTKHNRSPTLCEYVIMMNNYHRESFWIDMLWAPRVPIAQTVVRATQLS